MVTTINARPQESGLVEVLDKAGKTFCLLPCNEILSQNLAHRAIGVLAGADSGVILLSEKPDMKFNITAHAPLEADFAPAEFADKLMENLLGRKAPLLKIGQLTDGPALLSLYFARFSAPFIAASANSGLLYSHISEIPDLSAQGLITPFLESIFPLINQFFKSLTKSA